MSMVSLAVQVKIELGHRASRRTKQAPHELFTHDWEVFVRGPEGSNIQYFVEKVVFYLHDSFHKPKRVIKEPPYRVSEAGYGSFLLPIEIYFRNREEPKKIKFEYDLFLRLDDSPPVHHIRCEKLTFQNPTEDFRRKLIKAGGVGILGQNEVDKPQLTQQGTSASSANESSAFVNLFGTPLRPETVKDKPHKHDKTAKTRSTGNSASGGSPAPSSKSNTPTSTASTGGSSSSKLHRAGEVASKELKEHIKSSSGGKDKSGLKRSQDQAHSPAESAIKKKKTERAEKEKQKEKTEKEEVIHVISGHKTKHQDKDRSKDKKKSKHKSGKYKKKDEETSSSVKPAKDSSKPQSPASPFIPIAAVKPLPAATKPSWANLGDDVFSTGELSDDPFGDGDLEEGEVAEDEPEQVSGEKKSLNDCSNASSRPLQALETHIISDDDEMDDDDILSPLPKLSPLFQHSGISASPKPDKKKSTDISEGGDFGKKQTVAALPKPENETSRKGSSSRKSKQQKSKELFCEVVEAIEESVVLKPFLILETEKKANLVELTANKQSVKEDSASKGHSPVDRAPNGEELSALLDLQRCLMSMTDRQLLQKVVSVIEETGCFCVSDATFDFDLCSLDSSTVQRLKRCLDAAC